MANIPTIPGTARVKTADANVKADFNVLNAPNIARANMGEALQQQGQRLGDVAMKIQSAVNYGIAADADREMRQAAADFQQSRIGRADEDKWDAEWQEKSSEVWAKIQEKHNLPPLLKRQLTDNFKNWQQANAIEVKTMATKQRLNRSRERIGLAADEAARDGDEHAINQLIDGGVQSQLFLPEEGQKLKKDFGAKIDEYSARNFIMNNPAGAVDFIEKKDKDGKYVNLPRLNPDQRLTLLNTARVQFTKFQEDNYKDLVEGLQNGEVKTPEEMQGLVQSRVISPKQRASYERAYRHGKFNTDVAEQADVWREINSYDPQTDPTFEKRAEIMNRIATSGFATAVASDMNQLIGFKSDTKNVLNSPVAKEIFPALEDRMEKQLFGRYKMEIPDPANPEKVKTVINKEAYEKALAVKMQLSDAARKYLLANPQATAAEANAYISELQMGVLQKNGRTPLLQHIGFAAVPETAAEKAARLDALLKKEKKGK